MEDCPKRAVASLRLETLLVKWNSSLAVTLTTTAIFCYCTAAVVVIAAVAAELGGVTAGGGLWLGTVSR